MRIARPHRWRPQFGIRSLLAIPVVVAAYFAMGGATRNYGASDVERHILMQNDDRQPACYCAPLLLSVSHFDFNVTASNRFAMNTTTSYYFWLFGFVCHVRDTTEIDTFVESTFRETLSGDTPAIRLESLLPVPIETHTGG